MFAQLDVEKDMGVDKCAACKHLGYCTFPKYRVITQCEEFQPMDSAPALRLGSSGVYEDVRRVGSQ